MKYKADIISVTPISPKKDYVLLDWYFSPANYIFMIGFNIVADNGKILGQRFAVKGTEDILCGDVCADNSQWDEERLNLNFEADGIWYGLTDRVTPYLIHDAVKDYMDTFSRDEDEDYFADYKNDLIENLSGKNVIYPKFLDGIKKANNFNDLLFLYKHY